MYVVKNVSDMNKCNLMKTFLWLYQLYDQSAIKIVQTSNIAGNIFSNGTCLMSKLVVGLWNEKTI